jgi:cytochrome c biogenesis protein
VAQPEPYFDPLLPDRAAMDGVAPRDIGAVLRRNGFHVREAAAEDGTRFVYGDRHQYTKMATLLTHLGLILFLIAAAVTSRLGQEQGLVVAEGSTLTVGAIGTPGLLLVKNIDFEAPGFDTGHPTDFTTDLAVFQDGKQIARKTIRVNDPLSIAGYTFHQNGFGPAPHVVLKTAEGAVLWDAPVPMTDEASGLPYASIGVPGRDMGLKLFLDKDADGNGIVTVVPYTVAGTGADGQPVEDLYQAVDLHQGDVRVSQGLDLSIGLVDFGQFTLLIAKADPGQGIVWIAFASLIAGIAITFYRPRRRVWTRIAPDGRLGIVWRSDRYVDVEREFGRLLDQLVAVRQTG